MNDEIVEREFHLRKLCGNIEDIVRDEDARAWSLPAWSRNCGKWNFNVFFSSVICILYHI